MSRKLFIGLGAATLSMLLCSPTVMRAQDVVLSDLFGSGVHAYYAGDYQGAHQHFTDAVEGGSDDPRVYYFRALSYMKLGRDQEATQDLEKGASLEIQDDSGAYPVARSLERIQGQPRLMIESYRNRARVAAFQRDEKRRVERYSQTQGPVDDGSVPIADQPAAREAMPAAEANVTPSVEVGGAPAGEQPFAADVFGADAGAAGTPAAAPAGDPFSDPAAVEAGRAAAGAEAGEDPFAPAAAADMPAADAAPADAGGPALDIGAEPAPADAGGATLPDAEAGGPAADPFGAPAGGEAMPEEPAGGDAADPFGGDAGAMPADEPAAGEASDPFGAPGPAADPVGGEAAPSADGDAADPLGVEAGSLTRGAAGAESPPAAAGAAPRAPKGGGLGGLFRAVAKAVPVGEDASGVKAAPPASVAIPGAPAPASAVDAPAGVDPLGAGEAMPADGAAAPADEAVDPFADDPAQKDPLGQ